MPNKIDKLKEDEIKKLERKIGRVYGQAGKEVREKMQSFWNTHKVIDQKMQSDVASGKITQTDYQNWLRNQVFQGRQWQNKLDEITKVYQNADEEARKMVGDASKDAFMDGANAQAKQTERDVKGAVSFDLYDRHSVNRIIRDNPQMLPKWKINQPKDYIWNARRVRNSVAQGIIQGESVYDVGKRLSRELCTSNTKKMDMFARTAITGAHNAGRIERLHEAENMGIKVRKKWLSAHDARVRDAHIDLDGDEKDIDEPFVNDLGEIMYPGDPTADPANVYNCRCTMIYVYPDYEPSVQANQQEPEPEPEPEEETEPVVKYATTDDWIEACKSNPTVDEMLQIEEKNFGMYSSEEVNALEVYTGSSYTTMNQYLRLQSLGLSDQEISSKMHISNQKKSEIKLCQEALDKSRIDRDMVLRRGTDVGDIAGLFMTGDFEKNKMLLESKTAEELNNMFQGAVGTYAGFTSTSSQWDSGFPGDVEVLFNAPKGTAAASIMKISQYGTDEGETLLQSNTRVVCEKIERIGKKDSGWLHKEGNIRMFLTILVD